MTDNNENLTPQIRFKGFTDAWVQGKLGSVASIFDGTHQTPNYVDDGVMFLSVENINTLHSRKYISEADFLRNFKTAPEFGDILMTRIGDIGTANVVRTDEKLAYYVSLSLLKPKDSDADFLATSIHSPYVQKELWERTLHVAFPKKINLGEIENVKLCTPTLPEQTAIGNFFRTLDNCIAINQRKHDGLKKLKAAYLQQMFPQAGECVPRVRFDGFTEPWRETKLGEIADIIGGGTPDTSIVEYWDGEIDWYSPVEISEQIFVVGSQRKITSWGLQKSSAKILPIGTVLFTSRAGIGNTAILAKEGATNQGFQSISPYKDILDTYFIYSRTHELKRYGEINGAGSTFVEVSGKQMSNMPISVPGFQEQVIIGNFFCTLDIQITAQANKTEQLKQLKTAYLQKMFI